MKVKSLFFALCLCLCSLLSALDLTETAVIVKGQGSSAEAARQDALSQAVMKVVATMVEPKVLRTNKELIDTEILPHAQEMVLKYDVITPEKSIFGKYYIGVSVIVQPEKVRQSLINAGVIEGEVADVSAEEDADADEVATQPQDFGPLPASPEEAMNAFFDSLRVEDIMVPTLIDPQGHTGKSAQLGVTAIPGDEENLKVSMGIVIEFDTRYYTQSLLPKLRWLLPSIADIEGEVVSMPPHPLTDKYTTSLFDGAWKKEWTQSYHTERDCLGDKGKKGYIMVNVAGRYRESQNPFQYYKIKDEELFCGALQKFREKQKQLCVCFSLLDAENNEIACESWSLYPEADHYNQSYGNMYCFFFQTGIARDSGKVDPLLVINPSYIGKRIMRPFNAFTFDLELKAEELKKVRSMKVSFKYDAN